MALLDWPAAGKLIVPSKWVQLAGRAFRDALAGTRLAGTRFAGTRFGGTRFGGTRFGGTRLAGCALAERAFRDALVASRSSAAMIGRRPDVSKPSDWLHQEDWHERRAVFARIRSARTRSART